MLNFLLNLANPILFKLESTKEKVRKFQDRRKEQKIEKNFIRRMKLDKQFINAHYDGVFKLKEKFEKNFSEFNYSDCRAIIQSNNALLKYLSPFPDKYSILTYEILYSEIFFEMNKDNSLKQISPIISNLYEFTLELLQL